MALSLSNMVADGKLAPELSNEVFDRVSNESAIAKVAGRTEVSIRGTEVLIDTGKLRAAIVEEGQPKPTDQFDLGLATIKPLKAAVIVPWTKETRLANPAGVLTRIKNKMVEAIHEQIDAAVMYGKSVKDNKQVPGLAYLNQTKTRVELGSTTKANGGLTGDVVAGYSALGDKAVDLTGFVADNSMRAQFLGATDLQGRPLYSDAVDLKSRMGNVLGLPVSYTPAVSGRYGTGNTDNGVRMFGGDFQKNLKFGFVEDINIKITDTAYVGGVSLWETNQEAALVEAIFGFYINDVNNFVAYENKTAGTGA